MVNEDAANCPCGCGGSIIFCNDEASLEATLSPEELSYLINLKKAFR